MNTIPKIKGKIIQISSELSDKTRAELHSEGYWVTKDFQVLHVSEMEDSHLLNTMKFLQRKIAAHCAKTRIFYLSCPEPHGDGAMDAFDMECSYWLDGGDPESDLLERHPFYEHLASEMQKRNLWKDYV